MREIIFRGKDIYTNEWIEGNLIVLNKPITSKDSDNSFEKRYYIAFTDYWNRPSDSLEVDPKTIGQFTGLTDKNGVKIFEGDILSSSWGYRGEVQFDEIMYAKLECIFNEDCEVIGNIHDNPELLEVK